MLFFINTLVLRTHRIDYQASSPDEKALVEGIGRVGYIFTGEYNSILNIKLQAQRVRICL